MVGRGRWIGSTYVSDSSMSTYNTLNLVLFPFFLSLYFLHFQTTNNTAFVAVDFKELWLGIGGHHNIIFYNLKYF